jgi:hypothetical protein
VFMQSIIIPALARAKNVLIQSAIVQELHETYEAADILFWPFH